MEEENITYKIGDKVIIKPGRECSRPGVFTITSTYTEDSKRYYRLDNNSTVGWDPNNFIKIPLFLVGQVVTFKNVEDDRWPHSTDIDGELGMVALVDMHFYAPNKPGEDGNRYHVRSLKTGVCWHVTSASIELVLTVASLEDVKSISEDDPGPCGNLGVVANDSTLDIAQAVDNVKPRFKIGDKVIIKNDLIPGKSYDEWGGWFFLADMAQHMGKIAKIIDYGYNDPNYLRLDVDNGEKSWIVNSVLPYIPGSDYDLDETIITNKQQTKQNYENRLQESNSNLVRGSECKGRAVCYQKDQIAAAIGHSCYTGKVIRC